MESGKRGGERKFIEDIEATLKEVEDEESRLYRLAIKRADHCGGRLFACKVNDKQMSDGRIYGTFAYKRNRKSR